MELNLRQKNWEISANNYQFAMWQQLCSIQDLIAKQKASQIHLNKY